MTTPTLERVLKVPAVADHLSVHPDAVYRMIREGQIRHVRVGRFIRIPESALAEFITGSEG